MHTKAGRAVIRRVWTLPSFSISKAALCLNIQMLYVSNFTQVVDFSLQFLRSSTGDSVNGDLESNLQFQYKLLSS